METRPHQFGNLIQNDTLYSTAGWSTGIVDHSFQRYPLIFKCSHLRQLIYNLILLQSTQSLALLLTSIYKLTPLLLPPQMTLPQLLVLCLAPLATTIHFPLKLASPTHKNSSCTLQVTTCTEAEMPAKSSNNTPSPSKWLHVGLWNARSLNSKADFFNHSSSLAILAVTETWLTPNICRSKVHVLPLCYTIYWRDRGSRNGRVLLAMAIHPSQVTVFCKWNVVHFPCILILCSSCVPPVCSTWHLSDLAKSLLSLPTSSHLLFLHVRSLKSLMWTGLQCKQPPLPHCLFVKVCLNFHEPDSASQ